MLFRCTVNVCIRPNPQPLCLTDAVSQLHINSQASASTSRQLRYRHIMHPRNGNQPHTTGNYSSSHLLIIPTIKPEPFSALRFTQEKRKSRHHRSKRQIANRFPPSPVLFQFPNRARSSSRKDKSITFNFVRWFVRKATLQLRYVFAAMMMSKRTKEQVP
jgi:hypothetical protein